MILDIPTILQHIRPGAQWTVRDDLRDYSRLEWLDQSDKPTLEEITGAELEVAKAQRVALVKQEAADRILAAYPSWKQSNAALGLYDAAETQAIRDGINAIRQASNEAESAVNALDDVAEVISFSW